MYQVGGYIMLGLGLAEPSGYWRLSCLGILGLELAVFIGGSDGGILSPELAGKCGGLGLAGSQDTGA